VDTVLVGQTPLPPRAIAAGRHSVWFRSRPPGEFEPEPLSPRAIEVDPGDTAVVVEEVGLLVWIESDPSDAAVLTEGRLRGRTPLTLRWFSARDRDLVLEREGYRPHAVAAPALAGGRLRVRLEPVGAPERGPVVSGGPGAGVNWKAFASLGLCAVSAGAAVWLKEEADEAYERYERSAIPDDMRAHLDDARRYDRYSTAAWLTAETSFLAAVWILARPVLGLGPESDLLSPRTGPGGTVIEARWRFQ
jgi:hypothetical protein